MELTASYQKNVTAPVVTVTPSAQAKVDSAKPTTESKKPDMKATEVEKPKREPKLVAEKESESKPAKPNSTKRRIPTRRVRETQ
jgi:hypothetical protein